MKKINIEKIAKEFVITQEKLDSLIYQNNTNLKWKWNSHYNQERIKINILVEIGEFANEVKSFKILRKGVVNTEKAKEELIDCLSFFLGLVKILNIKLTNSIELENKNFDMNILLLDFFSSTGNLTKKSYLLNSYYEQWILTFFKIAKELKMDFEEVTKIYFLKNKINHERLLKEKRNNEE